MNKEKYIQYLESKGDSCDCPELSELFQIRKKAEKLERICDEFNERLDLENPKKEELDIILDYYSTYKKLEGAITHYKLQMTSLLNKENLKLNLHVNNGSWKVKNISLKELEYFSPSSIITINCSSCDQQIDILDAYEINNA